VNPKPKNVKSIYNLPIGLDKPGFLANLWVKTQYFPKKPGFFAWVRNSCLVLIPTKKVGYC